MICECGCGCPCGPSHEENPPQQGGHSYQDDFAGPYQDFDPPGTREPAAGEPEWGDVPYLPSYQQERSKPKEQPDNLFVRGSFYKGVSECHDEYCNRGGIVPRQYHTYQKHYHEPGMKNYKSITQTDYSPPYPKVAKGSQGRDGEMQQTTTTTKKVTTSQSKNFRSKQFEARYSQPELIYIDDSIGEDDDRFTTEHMDNYVCYQKPKEETRLKDVTPPEEEIFLQRVRLTHAVCPFGEPKEFLCEGSGVYGPPVGSRGTRAKDEEVSGSANRKDAAQTSGGRVVTSYEKRVEKVPERQPWLLYPRTYYFPHGYLILPNKDETQ